MTERFFVLEYDTRAYFGSSETMKVRVDMISLKDAVIAAAKKRLATVLAQMSKTDPLFEAYEKAQAVIILYPDVDLLKIPRNVPVFGIHVLFQNRDAYSCGETIDLAGALVWLNLAGKAMEDFALTVRQNKAGPSVSIRPERQEKEFGADQTTRTNARAAKASPQ